MHNLHDIKSFVVKKYLYLKCSVKNVLDIKNLKL
jgi:hypothetical protein